MRRGKFTTLRAVLRPGVLRGRTVALSSVTPGLGARLHAAGARVTGAGAGGGRVDTLVVDGEPAFSAAGGGYAGLRAGLDGAWAATRTVATAHWLDAGGAGQIVLLAPAPGAGRHAGALAVALENLARTLATEWARHAVTAVAVRRGGQTRAEAVADLVAWLATPAGAYVTGTALTLDGGR